MEGWPKQIRAAIVEAAGGGRGVWSVLPYLDLFIYRCISLLHCGQRRGALTPWTAVNERTTPTTAGQQGAAEPQQWN